MEAVSRILLKQRKSGKLINQKCIYFLKTHQQTVIIFVKCPGLLHFFFFFYKQAPSFKIALSFTSLSTARFHMTDLFGLLFICKIFGMALSLV